MLKSVIFGSDEKDREQKGFEYVCTISVFNYVELVRH